MSIQLNGKVVFRDDQLQNFIFDASKQEIEVFPDIEAGFYKHVQARVNTAAPTKQDVIIAVAEIWQVLQRNNVVGECEIAITQEQAVEITTIFYLLIKNGTSLEDIDLVKNIFINYDPATNTGSIEDWVGQHFPAGVDRNRFGVIASVKICKCSVLTDKNVLQRDAFLRLYREESGAPLKSIVHIVPDMTFGGWATDNDIRIRKIGSKLLSPDYAPEKAREISEVPPPIPPASSDDVIGAILDRLTSGAVPSECGAMKTENLRVLTVSSWPEFKVEWILQEYDVGCSKIVISIPVVRTRTATYVVYVYYSVPQDTGRSILAIAKVCVQRAALSGAVIGVVLGNLPAAITAFKIAFQSCIQGQIQGCVSPGLTLLKETTDWS